MREPAEEIASNDIDLSLIYDDGIRHAGPALWRAVIDVDFELPPASVGVEAVA